MPFIIQNLIPESQNLITITEDDTGQDALCLMVEHDFSQLPVVNADNILQGMITSDSLLRRLNYFNISLDKIKVSHATIDSRAFRLEDDIADLLQALRDINAVPIVDKQRKLKAVVTSYDTAEYFRNRAEDIMLAEEIETTVKDLVAARYRNLEGELDKAAIDDAIAAITSSGSDLKDRFRNAANSYISTITDNTPKFDRAAFDAAYNKYLLQPTAHRTLDELTLADFIQMFRNVWDDYTDHFKGLPWNAAFKLLDEVRKTRNNIAHFREVTTQQREQLKDCSNFLERHRPVELPLVPESELTVSSSAIAKFMRAFLVENLTTSANGEDSTQQKKDSSKTSGSALNPTEEEPDNNDSRYAPLAIWLQNQTEDKVVCSFEEVENIIDDTLPPSARNLRAWWANDSVSRVQSIQWLDAGWRVSSVNMTTEQVTFSRIEDLRRKYIDFYSQLREKLKQIKELSIEPQNIQGKNWYAMKVWSQESTSQEDFYLGFVFSRKSRFRIEIYIGMPDATHNKRIFDQLHQQKESIESDFGAPLSWERLDSKIASRVAYYRGNSSINSSEQELEAIQRWAVDILPKFYNAIAEKYNAVRQTVAEDS